MIINVPCGERAAVLEVGVRPNGVSFCLILTALLLDLSQRVEPLKW